MSLVASSVWYWPLAGTWPPRCLHFDADSPVGSPTIIVFVMRQNRYLNVIAAAAWLYYGCTVMFDHPSSVLAVVRNPIQCTSAPVVDRTDISCTISHLSDGRVVWKVCILRGFPLASVRTAHTRRERSERQMFELRDQLKNQYRAVQTAQIMERKAEQSKKRFVSYSE